MPESVLKQFNYFKVHTQYSICEGTVKIEDLKNYCRDNKIKSVGISDTNRLGSLVKLCLMEKGLSPKITFLQRQLTLSNSNANGIF